MKTAFAVLAFAVAAIPAGATCGGGGGGGRGGMAPSGEVAEVYQVPWAFLKLADVGRRAGSSSRCRPGEGPSCESSQVGYRHVAFLHSLGGMGSAPPAASLAGEDVTARPGTPAPFERCRRPVVFLSDFS
jgi:hypothetical protein